MARYLPETFQWLGNISTISDSDDYSDIDSRSSAEMNTVKYASRQ